MECVVEGVTYVSSPAITEGRCSGCAGYGDESLCVSLPPYVNCLDNSAIWIKKEDVAPTNTPVAEPVQENNVEIVEVFPVTEVTSEIGHQGNTFYFSSYEMANAASGEIDKGFGVMQPYGGIRCVKIDGALFTLGKDIQLSDDAPEFTKATARAKLVDQAIAKLSCEEAEALKKHFGGEKK